MSWNQKSALAAGNHSLGYIEPRQALPDSVLRTYHREKLFFLRMNTTMSCSAWHTFSNTSEAFFCYCALLTEVALLLALIHWCIKRMLHKLLKTIRSSILSSTFITSDIWRASTFLVLDALATCKIVWYRNGCLVRYYFVFYAGLPYAEQSIACLLVIHLDLLTLLD